jgi:lipopolysaccharide/colanic/teichoic acid biosynthesis glycosyltransferase
VIRRAIDVVVAAGVLALASPLLLVAAVAIKLTSKGPVIYRQRRVGRDRAEFDVLKLRTMVQGAEHTGAGLWVDEDDPRITRVGALLRRTSLDELPNLWNVLRGEMSLIGPRPTVPEQVAVYTERQLGRLAVKPGITGWAQVNGRAALPWGERIELDLFYIEHRSPALDARILARTVKVLLHGEDLYRGETGGWDLPHVDGYEAKHADQTDQAGPTAEPAREREEDESPQGDSSDAGDTPTT